MTEQFIFSPRKAALRSRSFTASFGFMVIGLLFASLTAALAQTNVPSMVLVKGGTLPPSSPLGAVSVQDFYIGKFEVTWKEWREVRDYAVVNGYDLENVGRGTASPSIPGPDLDSYPVHTINWYQALKWCNARSEKEGLAPVYKIEGATFKTGEVIPSVDPTANGYRLPTEAEWEWAATGGILSQGFTYAGGNTLSEVGWYWDNSSDGTKAVGLKSANELGLFDMSGNVVEWCQDVIGDKRAYRGGCWGNYAPYCTPQFRFTTASPLLLFWDLGLRVLRGTVDTDGDGLSNAVETGTGIYRSLDDTGTDPLDSDTDNDGFNDGVEVYDSRRMISWGSMATSGGGPWSLPPEDVMGVLRIKAGRVLVIAQQKGGKLLSWGGGPYDDGRASRVNGYQGASSFAAGGVSLVLTADGGVLGWGDSWRWQVPIPASLPPFVSISSGEYHCAGVTAEGHVFEWGADFTVQGLAPVTNFFRALPKVVKEVSCGQFHTLALNTDGTVSAWGQNSSGQTNVPPGLSGVIQVVAGSRHSLALKSDGTVVAWGSNGSGEATVPSGLSGVVQLSAKGNASIARKSDGTLVHWGLKEWEQPGKTRVRPEPQLLTNILDVSHGWEFVAAIRGRNPNVADSDFDSDGDGLNDQDEVGNFATGPFDADTDDDGMADGWEVANGFDPKQSSDALHDADTDGLSNLQEFERGTNPKNADTDGDGMADGWEVANGFDPKQSSDGLLDADADSLTNVEEFRGGTNPRNADTDGDGASDYRENADGTNPNDVTSFDPLSKSLVAYYPFDGNANDESGSARNGTVYGAVKSSNLRGEPNKAYRFVDDWIKVPVVGSVFANDYTISVWAKCDDFAAGSSGQLFLLSGNVGAINLSAIGSHDPLYGNHPAFYMFRPQPWTQVPYNGMFADQPLNAGEWAHIVVRRSSSNYRIYVNGRLASEKTDEGVFPLADSYVEVGNAFRDAPMKCFFRGSIDNLRFYNRALDSAEIGELYRAEFGAAPIISLNGSNTLIHEVGTSFSDPGATVRDDKDPVGTVSGTGIVDTSQAGTYTLTYSATDSDGNPAQSVTRIVYVVSNTNPAADEDSDGVTNYRELGDGTDLNNPESLNVLSKGLVAYYPFDVGLGDESGFGKHLDQTGNFELVSDLTGGDGKSLRRPSKVNSGAWSSVNSGVSGNAPRTVSFWFYSDGPHNWPTGGTLTMAGNGFIIDSGRGYILIDNNYHNVQTPPIANLHQRLHQFVWTYENNLGNSKFYIDGKSVPVEFEPGFGSPDYTLEGRPDLPIFLGGLTDNGFQGKLDDVRLYNRVLTGAEVAQLYRSEKGPVPIIQLNGSASLRVELGAAFVDPGAVVIDDDDDERSIIASGSVDTSTAGTYTLTYTATDSDGNEALPVTRVVEVGTDWVYSVNGSNEVTITGYTGPGGNVTVPSTLGGHPVKNFGNGQSVFGWWNNSVTNVVLPSSVTAIGDYAFAWSPSLLQVSLPSGLTTIGNGAFQNTSISTLDLPAGLTSIGSSAFAGCSNLTSMDWPQGATTIPEGVFSGSGLTQFTIPSTVTSIGSSAFANCRNLTNLALPNGVTSIGSSAFGGTGLTSIVLPGSIEYIGDNNNSSGGGWWSAQAVYGLSDCPSLTSITISEGTKGINAGAFANLRYLTNIVIAGSVTSIGDGAFYGAGSYTSWWGGGGNSASSLNIMPASDTPYSSIGIGNSAFAYSGITHATISRGNVYFGTSAFASSPLLAGLSVPTTSGVDFGESSFAGCSNLISIGSPAYIWKISNRAFENTGLRSVRLPLTTVSGIGAYAFSGAASLGRVELVAPFPASAWSISQFAFNNCTNLSEVVFPTNGVSAVSVESYAFANCTSLTSIDFPDRPNGVGSWQWNGGSFYPIINSQAFDSCTSLVSVTIGSSVHGVSWNAFSGCSNLTNATLSMDVISGFKQVNSLASVAILRGVIDVEAFYGCSNLSSVALSEGVTVVGSQAFAHCLSLTNITIPSSVASFGVSAFGGSINLVNINVAEGNPNYFDDDGVLYSGTPQSPGAVVAYPPAKAGNALDLPPGLSAVSSGAFDSARHLETVTFPSSVTSIGYRAFASSAVVGLYFEGDAPGASMASFESMPPAATIYRYAASNGFDSTTWNGLPVVVMNNGTTSVRSWLQNAGFDPATSLSADPGQRGVPLLQAYAFNVDPHSMQNTQVPRPQMVGQNMSMRFYASSPGVNYVVETSDDLRSWTTNNVSVSLPDDSGHSTATMPMSANRRFMRIKLTGPQ